MSLKQDLTTKVSEILSQKWNTRDGRVVPSTEDVALAGGAVKLNATVLYADLSQSSKLATDFQQRTAAKVIRSFLYCMSNLITRHEGAITSFDGDRVMGVFLGKAKNSNAAQCALRMNYTMVKIVGPKLSDYFVSLRKSGFPVSHCVGIDTGSVLAIRAGQRGSNDLVWIGRAPNLAAKLSDIRENDFRTYVSADVFDTLNKKAKYSNSTGELMWQKRSFEFVGSSISVYRSSWWRSL